MSLNLTLNDVRTAYHCHNVKDTDPESKRIEAAFNILTRGMAFSTHGTGKYKESRAAILAEITALIHPAGVNIMSEVKLSTLDQLSSTLAAHVMSNPAAFAIVSRPSALRSVSLVRAVLLGQVCNPAQVEAVAEAMKDAGLGEWAEVQPISGKGGDVARLPDAPSCPDLTPGNIRKLCGKEGLLAVEIPETEEWAYTPDRKVSGAGAKGSSVTRWTPDGAGELSDGLAALARLTLKDSLSFNIEYGQVTVKGGGRVIGVYDSELSAVAAIEGLSPAKNAAALKDEAKAAFVMRHWSRMTKAAQTKACQKVAGWMLDAYAQGAAPRQATAKKWVSVTPDLAALRAELLNVRTARGLTSDPAFMGWIDSLKALPST